MTDPDTVKLIRLTTNKDKSNRGLAQSVCP